jgi:tRNA pseudouridine55 synthase
MALNGILVVNKPAGMTSHDVVARIRRAAGQKRVGHTGTLDPDVEGVLPICLGTATRLSEYMLMQAKGYQGTVRFGYSTTTQDASGEVVERAGEDAVRERVTEQTVELAMLSFVGDGMQIPPAYSAIKIAGKRSYELARSGVEVTLQARPVSFYQIQLTSWNPNYPIPEASFEVYCSKGTYIRTLCQDLGQALGIPAHMASLTRIQSGPFSLAEAHTLEEIDQSAQMGNLRKLLLPGQNAIPFMSEIRVREDELAAVWNGRSLVLAASRIEESNVIDVLPQFLTSSIRNSEPGSEVKVLDQAGSLCAIYQLQPEVPKSSIAKDGIDHFVDRTVQLRPVKVFKE